MNPNHNTLSDLTGTVREVQNELRDRYKATEVRITANPANGTIDVRLEFRGFESLADALDRVGSVSLDLENDHAADVHAGVSGTGFFHQPDDGDVTDTRPAGWVTAIFEEG